MWGCPFVYSARPAVPRVAPVRKLQSVAEVLMIPGQQPDTKKHHPDHLDTKNTIRIQKNTIPLRLPFPLVGSAGNNLGLRQGVRRVDLGVDHGPRRRQYGNFQVVS